MGARTSVSVIWDGSISTVAASGLFLSVDWPYLVIISSDHGPVNHVVVLSFVSLEYLSVPVAKGSVEDSALSDHVVSFEMTSTEKGMVLVSWVESISFEVSEVFAEKG